MMRCGDIRQGPKPTEMDMTPELYIRSSKMHPIPIEEHTTEDLRRAMCQKSGGDVNVCRTCPGGCRLGRELVRRMERNATEADTNEAV